MPKDEEERPHELWARLRFSIVGPLLAAPPARGQLRSALRRLSEKQWLHPITKQWKRFGFSTIERWYYRARREKVDPVRALRRKRRGDSGRHRVVSEGLRQVVKDQYQGHRSWSYQLHVDNLAAVVKKRPELGPMPSYSTMRRYMKGAGLVKQRR